MYTSCVHKYALCSISRRSSFFMDSIHKTIAIKWSPREEQRPTKDAWVAYVKNHDTGLKMYWILIEHPFTKWLCYFWAVFTFILFVCKGSPIVFYTLIHFVTQGMNQWSVLVFAMACSQWPPWVLSCFWRKPSFFYNVYLLQTHNWKNTTFVSVKQLGEMWDYLKIGFYKMVMAVILVIMIIIWKAILHLDGFFLHAAALSWASLKVYFFLFFRLAIILANEPNPIYFNFWRVKWLFVIKKVYEQKLRLKICVWAVHAQ